MAAHRYTKLTFFYRHSSPRSGFRLRAHSQYRPVIRPFPAVLCIRIAFNRLIDNSNGYGKIILVVKRHPLKIQICASGQVGNLIPLRNRLVIFHRDFHEKRLSAGTGPGQKLRQAAACRSIEFLRYTVKETLPFAADFLAGGKIICRIVTQENQLPGRALDYRHRNNLRYFVVCHELRTFFQCIVGFNGIVDKPLDCRSFTAVFPRREMKLPRKRPCETVVRIKTVFQCDIYYPVVRIPKSLRSFWSNGLPESLQRAFCL